MKNSLFTLSLAGTVLFNVKCSVLNVIQTLMLPVLINLPFIKLYTFGVFLVLALFWSTFLLWKNIRLTSYKEEELFDGTILSLIGGLLVGRLWYVVMHFDAFGFSVLKFILINGYPGLVLYGCLLGFFITFLLYCLVKKIEFRMIIDYVISPLFVALAIGKIGSFFSGVEVGTKTKFWLALKYTNFDGLRHLTALYEAIFFFAASYITYRLLFSIRREQYWKGMLLGLGGLIFSAVYFVFDPLKSNRTLVYGVSMNWAVSAILLLTFILYFLYYLRSSIFGGTKRVSNSLQDHVKKTISDVHSKTTKKVRGRNTKNKTTDSEVEKG